MRFLDKAKIYIKAGNGGNGCISFRREKYVEFGGPNGGNGGDGGNVYITIDKSLNTLIDFRYKQHFKAQSGKSGKGKNLFGVKGKNLIISVPSHTIIWNETRTLKLAELNEHNPTVLIAKGGLGGKGNASFKSSTNQAPKFAEQGTTGEELWLWLELQLFADVGLIGLPNAGKSTFLSVVTNAKTKIADYPFSTTIPVLGVATVYDNSFVIADIPGLINGASEGKGLGFHFLAHIIKCKILLHFIDCANKDYYKSFLTIVNELNGYHSDLSKKKQIIVITKTDTISEKDLNKKLASFKNKLPEELDILTISTVNNNGINTILSNLYNIIINDNLYEEQEGNKKNWSPI